MLRCIGTSATVSDGAGGDEGLIQFVSELFGEEFLPGNIIGESVVARRKSKNPYLPPFPSVKPDQLSNLNPANDNNVLELARTLTGREIPRTGTITQKITAMLSGNRFVELLEEACDTPKALTEIASFIAALISEYNRLSQDEKILLIEAYLLVGCIGNEEDMPYLRPKLHTFFHGVYDVGLCMNPACRTLVKNGSNECPACGSAVRPAALCRTCGQDFVKVKFTSDPNAPTIPNDDFRSDENTGFITPLIHVEATDDEEDDVERQVVTTRGRKPATAARERLRDMVVCHQCGTVHNKEVTACISCGYSKALAIQKVLRGGGNTCPVCNSTYTRGDVLTLLRSGIASTVSLLASHHLDRLTDKDRKLLLFADNRQDAAHQASYINDRQRQFAVRHAIESIVRDRGERGVSFDDLPVHLLAKLQEMGLAKQRLTTDERDKWDYVLRFDAAGEFCRSTHRRISLENLALVEVSYEFLCDI
jgi:ribosomal protein L32